MYKHKANQLKKEDKISLQWSVSSPMNHWYLNSAYSLKKREKKVNKQAKLYSTTMYTAPQVKERAGAMMKGKGVKQRLQWNKSPSWHRDLSYSCPQKESGGGEEGGGGGRDAPPEKKKTEMKTTT